MRFYEVVVGSDSGPQRRLRVASPTDAQAADAAAPLMRAHEAILSIQESPDDGLQQADAPPPKTQAEEMAPDTPGMAAKS
ncbi:hypothetical protein [Brevundimonas naejangsanensis]|uniref:hypothetical protein n=1 Tax=Brevundimonas naejangsanensis TaxID=588932 RepID=UPI000E7F2172|nr:hypothetical protein [Brevundimonas naejangsanensis]HAC01721.1 hypothetical protein [Brevundimonas sp.]HBV13550.1 hypothetical protein [Brevundimonas sp.]HCW48582.1 hypothetical protein [Brevundimonas sp.]